MSVARFPTIDEPPATFRDPELEAAYRRDGYVVIPLLGPAEVQRLLEGHAAGIAHADDERMAIDFDRADRSKMAAARALALPVVEPLLDRWFVDHRVAFASFIAKHPGPDSNMSMHEDRTWVDERRYRSGTLWVPLVDVGPELGNGCLELVPRSHRLATSWSGTGTPRPFEDHVDRLVPALVPVALPAGSAIFCDSRTLHASEPNRSDAVRVALAMTVVPRAAALIHVVATGPTQRAIHAVDEAFYVEHGAAAVQDSMPDRYPVIEEVEDDSVLSAAAVDDLLASLPRRLDPSPAPARS